MRDEKCKLRIFVAVKDNITPTSQLRGSKKATEKSISKNTSILESLGDGDYHNYGKQLLYKNKGNK